MSDHQRCKWCGETTRLDSLVGFNTNQCPQCGNPVFPMKFAQIKPGTVFVCNSGGMWCKFSDTHAVCVAMDSGYSIGEQQEFNPEDEASPF